MCSNLSYQLKIDWYMYRLLCVNLMVTTNQKHNRDKKLRERNPNIMLKENIKPQGKKARENEKNREELEKQPENNTVVISIYLSIITLNVNGLNYPIKRHRVVEWIKKNKQTRFIYTLPTRDQLQR